MSYEKAIEAAGAKILCCEYFGSYSGDIWMKVKHNDRRGWINIAYGSCSGCDSYEAWSRDFGWDFEPSKEQLAEFGRDYLDSILTQEEAEKEAERFSCYGIDDEAALRFVRERAEL